LKRILIVDDETAVAFFLQEGLSGLGDEYQVSSTPSAELALEQIRDQPFDLLVIDYCLPGIDGLDLIERLESVSPNTRTILITAYDSPEIQNAAHRLRAYHYFAKPFPIQDLMSTVEKALA